MDVVPVDGQNWLTDPFLMSARNGRLYGRGCVDMKGFLAVSFVGRYANGQSTFAATVAPGFFL
ncbi:M20/M25/M40 family metallo-hydrolase [Rhizobium beringeri]